MVFQLNPGFQATVEIRDNHTILFQKTCATSQELQGFISKYSTSKPGWSWIKSTVMPLRTDHLKNYATDLFFPTCVHFSLKINNKAVRIILSSLAVIFDLATLPIRAVATPFRFKYNRSHPEQNHPLVDLLQDRVKNLSSVQMNFKVENTLITTKTTDIEGHSFQNGTQTINEGTVRLALKRMPGGITSKSSQSSSTCHYLIMDGEWVLENSNQSSSSHYQFAC